MLMLGSVTAATALGWIKGAPHHGQSHIIPALISLIMPVVRGGYMVADPRHLAVSHVMWPISWSLSAGEVVGESALAVGR